jgi:uncharacterized protein (TIGR02284 family)
MATESTRVGNDDVSNETTIDTLNRFLRGEISAVETYRMALDKIEDATLRARLEEIHKSHEARAAKLRNRISQLGGMPADSSGAWGGFAKLVEGGAKAFGTKAALAALEEGEDHGLRLYRDDLDKLDSATRSFTETELLSSQQRSHDAMSSLKHSVH